MKKKRLFIFLFALSLLAVSPNLSAQTEKMTGITVIPSFYGPGVGFRQWVNANVGWGLEAQPSWQFNDFVGRGRFMYSFHTTESMRVFGLASVGYMSINEVEDAYEYHIASPTVVAGLGAEWMRGMMGFGLELGYQYGKADYSYTISAAGFSFDYNGTYKVFPVYIGATASFYIFSEHTV